MKTLTLNTPHNLLMAATFFANKGYREGKCISHSQVIEEIKQLGCPVCRTKNALD